MFLCALMFPVMGPQLIANQKDDVAIYKDGRLDNGIIPVAFDLEQASFTIHDAKTHEPLLSDARFELPSGEPPAEVAVMKTEEVHDALGSGWRVILQPGCSRP